MSLQIKFDHPLTKAERAYLVACNREAEIVANDVNYPSEHESTEESYSDWTVKNLKAEIDNRNAKLRGPSDQIPVGKTKEDLVSALEADDATHPDEVA